MLPMDGARRARAVLDRDEVNSVLSGEFYAPNEGGRRPKLVTGASEKPAHYKVICISMYTRDLEQLDSMVEELKARGLTKANRSALIRFALGQVDLATVPRGL
ncbi:MAG TPA: hypothetical protein VK540_03255 [Polyangiaceae bacterium]|jgi:hypothetical protein|nr:hypothetical protein [Polyangiaceae bacterium]